VVTAGKLNSWTVKQEEKSRVKVGTKPWLINRHTSFSDSVVTAQLNVLLTINMSNYRHYLMTEFTRIWKLYVRVPCYESDLQPTTLIWAKNNGLKSRIRFIKQGVSSKIHKTCVSIACFYPKDAATATTITYIKSYSHLISRCICHAVTPYVQNWKVLGSNCT